jgi:hypothetical protein
MGVFRTTARARRRRRRRRRPARIGRALRKVSLAPVRATRPSGGHPLRTLRRPSWKLVGLAGVAGVAATGVIVARNRRAHSELAPDELRERLHRRLAEAGAGAAARPPA